MRSVSPSTIRSACAYVALAVISSSSFAQGAANNPHLRFSKSHHWTFSEIGDVGNAPHEIPSGSPSVPPTRIGGVNYRYRIATTEVTWGQYFEFVQAHAPTLPRNLWGNIEGVHRLNPHVVTMPSPITFVGQSGGIPQFIFNESWSNRPAEASWRNYARFVNWLHNGAPSADIAVASDFERGAYDTSTFDRVQGPSGIFYFTDQDSRSDGARYWIPSLDELTKAAFYDPNRHGEGQGGYWEYPTSSDTAPIPGDPALGGETNAGSEAPHFNDWPAGQFRPLDVGSYPDTQSPWGLLDTMGSGLEITETWTNPNPEFHGTRYIGLTGGLYNPLFQGDLGDFANVDPNGTFSLRLASVIPSPGGAGALAPLALGIFSRARRERGSHAKRSSRGCVR